MELGGGALLLMWKQEKVRRGDKLITFDAELIKAEGKSLVTPMVNTNMAARVKNVIKHLDDSDQWVMEVELKS